VSNTEIVSALKELAMFMDMSGIQFKPRAFEKAAQAIEGLDGSIRDMYAADGLKTLMEIPHVGKGIAERIEEMLKRGVITQLEEYRKETPVDLVGLTSIEGLGPKSVKVLYVQLGVKNIDDLELACKDGKIRSLPRFGEKSEQKIMKGIELLRQQSGRMPIGKVLELSREIEERLRRRKGVTQAAAAGSIRRRRESIGDLDFLVVSDNPEPIMDFFTTMPEVQGIHARGSTKSMVRLGIGIDADIRVVPAESFGAALLYFTGSKDHNVTLRKIAIEKGLKLNEYGLFRGEECIAGLTEESVYEALDLEYCPPEIREDRGEIDAARSRTLPVLVGPGDLLGDLQTQTSWTDGRHTIEEMALAAQKLGRQYIAITDHTRDLAMMGMDEEKLLTQVAEIRKLNEKLAPFRILAGAEVNIRKDGTLDVSDEVLAQLDVVGIAVHHHFGLPRDEMTARVIKAMENPHADIYFHPTARSIGKRQPIDLDLDAVIAAAKRTGTVLEIDAHPERLDLRDDHARKVVDACCKIVIDSDAHATNELRFPDDYGLGIARRAWAQKADVINTLPVDKFLAALKGGRASAPNPAPAPLKKTKAKGAEPKAEAKKVVRKKRPTPA
jgi:DNA polymerase (family X)